MRGTDTLNDGSGTGCPNTLRQAPARWPGGPNRPGRAARAGRGPRGGGFPTSEAAAKGAVKLHSRRWKVGSPVARGWGQTLADHAFPLHGRKSVAEVASGEAPAVLTPIRHTGSVTPKKVRQRAGAAMKRAGARDRRNDNPAGRSRSSNPSREGQRPVVPTAGSG